MSLSLSSLSALNRRDFLGHLGSGLGQVALVQLLANSQARANAPYRPPIDERRPHLARSAPRVGKAKQVLQIFCSGACSHLDSWDYKPELIKRDGQPLPGMEKLITFQGANGNLTRSPWQFRRRGQSGKWISDLFPKIGELADDLCFIHSMTAKSNTHGPAESQMNTGFVFEGFPSIGSWVSYALGTENQDLPAFVAIPDPRGIPQIGPANWSSGFLPAVFQGTSFSSNQQIPNLFPLGGQSEGREVATRDFLKRLNDQHLAQHPGDTNLAARISAYELAARLQLSAPEVGDLSRETRATQDAYGVTHANATLAGFGRNCLLARRLLEKGVRFVQLFNGAYAMGEGVGNWDGHKRLKDDYERHAPIMDQPVAALLKDMKQRGMLDETLVIWTTEFGRMPTFQVNAQGRDHNPAGFTAWMAGAGVKKGFSHGATDDFGHKAVQDVATVYDFHATVLHLLGLDHETLSVYHNGIERRLTDVHGHPITEVLA